MSSGESSNKKPYVTAGDYAFATPELYDQLVRQVSGFKPLLGDVIYVRPTADGKSLEMPVLGNFGKLGDKPPGSYALRKTIDPTVLQRTLREMIDKSQS
jgi:hypothetical protein